MLLPVASMAPELTKTPSVALKAMVLPAPVAVPPMTQLLPVRTMPEEFASADVPVVSVPEKLPLILSVWGPECAPPMMVPLGLPIIKLGPRVVVPANQIIGRSAIRTINGEAKEVSGNRAGPRYVSANEVAQHSMPVLL